MKSIQLRKDLSMPALGLGTWKAAGNEVGQALEQAIGMGYRHIDCAAIYGNEKEIGEALQRSMRKHDLRREDFWITSKLWNNSHEQEQVAPALEQSLKDLQLDYLDLYLIHWPIAQNSRAVMPKSAGDFLSLDQVPLSETWNGMQAVHKAGKCRSIGVSNFSASKLMALIAETDAVPAVNQIELHPYLQQKELLDGCRAMGVHLTAYAPLGSYDRNAAPNESDTPILLADPTLLDIAAQHKCTAAQVLLAWGMKRGTSVIPKSVNPERLAENFAAAQVELTAADMEAIGKLDRAQRFISGDFWVLEGGPYTLANIWDE